MALAMHRRLSRELPQLASKTLLNDGLSLATGSDVNSILAGLPEKPAAAAKGKKPGDLASFTVLLAGPSGSPYEGGVFRLQVSVPTQYPLEPPKMKFETRIYHPNVGQGHTPGAICLDILRKEAWSPALTIERTLISIASLMADPNPASPMDGEAASLYTKNRKKYDARVREWVAKYARPDSKAAGEGAWTSDFGKADQDGSPAAQDIEAEMSSPTKKAKTAKGKAEASSQAEGTSAKAAATPLAPAATKATEQPTCPKAAKDLASADLTAVIDLASSDDEPEPKRARTA